MLWSKPKRQNGNADYIKTELEKYENVSEQTPETKGILQNLHTCASFSKDKNYIQAKSEDTKSQETHNYLTCTMQDDNSATS